MIRRPLRPPVLLVWLVAIVGSWLVVALVVFAIVVALGWAL